jgi:hypothetical protein
LKHSSCKSWKRASLAAEVALAQVLQQRAARQVDKKLQTPAKKVLNANFIFSALQSRSPILHFHLVFF